MTKPRKLLIFISFAIVIINIAWSVQKGQQYWKKDFGPLVPHTTFPKDCKLCHIAKRWDILRSDFHFDHEKETGYRLEGAHAFASCLRCHNDRGPVRNFSSKGCGGCHSDPHKSSMGFDCERCHNQNTWQPSGGLTNHAQTRFPLTGMHVAVDCLKCHTRASTGDFKGAPTDCYSCHTQQYQQGPNHVAMNYSHSCQDCHNTASWVRGGFNHSSLGPNPDCYSCHSNDFVRGPNHVSGNFSHSCQNCHNTTTWAGGGFNHNNLGPNPDCYSCHANDFVQGPNHVSGNFSHSCQNCHNTTTWSGAGFNHSNLGPNPDCYSCHSANFNQAPNHVAHNYPHGCASCHNTSTWNGATFNHNALGANPTCYTCHQQDYQQGPNHVSMSYPTTCQNCHNTNSWSGASLNHQFRLTGHHNVSCTTCHQGGNTTTFTCLTCHAHSQSSMDNRHQGISGYHYDSLSCYQCHPRG